MKTTRLSLLALSLLLAACGGGDAPGRGGAGKQAADEPQVPEQQRFGGTAIVATIGEIPDINPLTSTDHTSDQIEQFVLFTPLIRYNEKFEPEPYFAERWEVNADTTELTFHLRRDVFWHDGPRTTAYDVQYAYEMATNPETGFPNTAFWTHYGEGTAVDSFTWKVKMRPHSDYMDPWRTFSPSPRHILEGTPPAQMKNHPFGTRSPVGNGPFRFVSHTPNQNWVFEANPDFPAAMGGRPYVDRLVYRVIPEPTTLLTELLNGNIDYYIAVSPDQVEQVERSPSARIVSFPDRAFVMIGWNQRREMFRDVRVRRALTMALNRQAIVDAVRRGYGELGNSTIPPFFWNYDPRAGSDLRYDTAAARRLLREAGWEDRNGDGVIENAAGTPFRFTLVTNQGNRERQDITEIVQAQLRQLGIQAQPQILEWGTLLDKINDVERRDFDAVLIGWVTEFRIDDVNLFHCEKQDEPYQWVSYCNPRTDRLLDTLPTIVDHAAARPLWQQYQRQIAEDQPYTILYFQRRIEGVHQRLRNVNPDARGDWVGASKWYILPEQRNR